MHQICIFSVKQHYTTKSTSFLANYHQTKTQLEAERLEILAAQRDPRRFGVLYERYYEQIYLFIFKRMQDEEQAGDVTSQVFLKAINNLKRYKFKGVPYSSWLYRIALNEVNQFFRDNKSQRHVSMESGGLYLLMEEVEEEKDDSQVQQMLRIMEDMSSDDIQMIELRYFEKMPFKEIADIYNITENNAKVRLYRILGKMKKRFTA